MDLDAARDFVREHHHCVLSTRRADGRPQLSPVAVSIDDGGRFVISSRETAMKTKNIRRDPEVSVCVISDGFFGPWIQVDGSADVVELPDAMEGLVDYYRSVSGEHEDWDAYRKAMVDERRVLLAVTATRAGPDRAG